MSNSDFRLHQAAYQRGLRAGRCDANPFDDVRRTSWDRGHRDRWLHNIRPQGSYGALAAKMLLAAGAAVIICSFFNALTGA